MADSPGGPGYIRQVPAIVLGAIAIGIAVRGALVALPPLFLTDVSFYNTQAVGYLLHGVDPYGATYAVPPALATPGAGNVFAYLPGVFAFLVPGDFGTGARLGLVACDAVVALSLLLAKPRTGGVASALYLLLPPVVVFSTSFLNDSLPAIAFLSVAALLEAKGRPMPAAAFWGLAFASSQEAWFVFPVYLAFSLRRRSYAALLVMVAVAAAVVAPFFAWNPGAFASDTVLFQFQRQAASLISTGPFGVNVNPSLQGVLLSAGVSAPLVVRGALAAMVIGVVVWRSERDLAGLALGGACSVAASLFLLSGDFFWSYLELPFVLFLFWAVLRVGGPSTLKEPSGPVASSTG